MRTLTDPYELKRKTPVTDSTPPSPAPETSTPLEDFRKAMELRSAMHVRVARRVTLILRIGMLSFAVVGALLVGLLYTVTNQLVVMNQSLHTMNRYFVTMAQEMTQMRGSVADLEEDVHELPVILREMQTLAGSMGVISSESTQIADRFQAVNRNLDGLSLQVIRMTGQFGQIDMTVNDLNANVHRMSRPMRFFQNFVPLP
ncbi:MAG: hypothetical protein HQM03_06640 [Magnetococcales bacterium]|nr:hypothetical protein [Magnetococcales bacterium]